MKSSAGKHDPPEEVDTVEVVEFFLVVGLVVVVVVEFLVETPLFGHVDRRWRWALGMEPPLTKSTLALRVTSTAKKRASKEFMTS